MCRIAVEDGIQCIVATPHFDGEFLTDADKVKGLVRDLGAALPPQAVITSPLHAFSSMDYCSTRRRPASRDTLRAVFSPGLTITSLICLLETLNPGISGRVTVYEPGGSVRVAPGKAS